MVQFAPRHGRFIAAFAVGVVVALGGWLGQVQPAFCLLIGADAFFLLYLGLMLWFVRKAGPAVLQRHAGQGGKATQRQISTDELARARTALHEVEVALASLNSEQQALRDESERLTAEVGEARGEYDSVAARGSALNAQVTAVTALVAARSEVVAATRARAEARETLHATLSARGFADVEDYLRARLSEAEVETLRGVVQTHDAAVTAATAILSAPELQGLPAVPVDVEPLRLAGAEADVALHRAVRQHGIADERLRTARALADQLRAAWERTAQQRGSFETLQRLARSLHGESPNTRRLRLESYVLAVELAEITEAANGHLAAMSSWPLLPARE